MDTNWIISVVAFVVLTLSWLGFGVALLFRRELLDQTWHVFRSWPLIVQLVVALFALPVVLGLWIWQTSWPAWLRLALVAGLAFSTIYTFFPRLPLA